MGSTDCVAAISKAQDKVTHNQCKRCGPTRSACHRRTAHLGWSGGGGCNITGGDEFWMHGKADRVGLRTGLRVTIRKLVMFRGISGRVVIVAPGVARCASGGPRTVGVFS